MNEYSTPTQFIDLAAQQKIIRPYLDSAISRVLDHGQYIMGPEVKEFETQLIKYSSAKHAITCANGTDALSLVLMSWDVGPGDVVFVPSFTYVASAEAPAQLGATPFFIDVDKDTFNVDPDSFKQAIMDCRKIGLTPKAVITVDLFGLPSDVDSITEIAHSEGIKVLVDGAQSFGATSKARAVGSMGDATTTSFFPAKPLGCYGDGGAVFTNNDTDAELINSIRLHGKGAQKYDNIRIGLNSRLDTIQAAILIEKIKLLPDEIISRNKVASKYEKDLSTAINTPKQYEELKSAWAQYTLVTNNRDQIQDILKKAKIPSVVYYPIPLNKQKGYEKFPVVSSGVKISSQLADSVLSLPMHPYLKTEAQEHVINNLLSAIESL